MRFAQWCLAAAVVCGAHSAEAQHPRPTYVNNAYYYPQAYPQRTYYQTPYPTYYPPVQQAQALYGMQPPYPVMGNPAASNYYRPTGPTPYPPGVANGGWNLNYYPPPPNPMAPLTPTYNVPKFGMPITPASASQPPIGTSWPAPTPTSYPLPGGDVPPPPPVPFHRKTCEKGWISADFLMAFSRPMRTPGPLVTTGSSLDPIPGAIGQPGTVALFGTNNIDFGMFAGVRVGAGLFVDTNDRFSFDVSAFWTVPNATSFSATGDAGGNPVIARPFVDVRTGVVVPDTVLAISSPGLLTGTTTVDARSLLGGFEVNGRAHSYCKERCHVDGLLGIRFVNLSEQLTFRDQVAPLAAGALTFQGAAVTAPNSLQDQDRFQTSNQFFGAQAGFRASYESCWYTIEAYGKAGIGVTRQRVEIDGSTTLVTPGGNTVVSGGVLALPSNIGQYSRTIFGMVPEFGINLGVDVTDHVRFKLGYSILLWDHVVRPAGQIDSNVNSGQQPRSPNFNATTGPNNPLFRFNDEFFWTNFFSVGVEAHF